jgi:hypothetical protein
MSESKIQIKVGHVEFSGEGNQEWLAEQLEKVLVKIPELVRIEKAANPVISGQNFTHTPANPNGMLDLSMVSIAAKLKCKSGQDLATAAAAHLKIVQSRPTFSRDDILKHMKEATGYYKGSYSNNLTNILVSLVKNDSLTQSSENAYSLHVNKENELNGTLGK